MDESLRDAFAAVALNALIAGNVMRAGASIRDHADLAYDYADAMLAARERANTEPEPFGSAGR